MAKNKNLHWILENAVNLKQWIYSHNYARAENFRMIDIKINAETAELGTFQWWIMGLMLDPLFFLISRLNNACYPLVIIISKAGNFWMEDIGINAWSTLFLNLQIK